MGYVDFDGKRYFDTRELSMILSKIYNSSLSLESDANKRMDATTLLTGDVDLAQERKEQLEMLQRKDRRLREAAHKRREEGGAKYEA